MGQENTSVQNPPPEEKARTTPAAILKRRDRLLRNGRLLGRHLWSRLKQDNVPGVAASLSYTSLLALVPLLSISVAVLTAFPVFDSARDSLQRLVFDTFVPASGEAIEAAVTRFVEATGRLTAIGVAGLAVTSVMLLVTIEKAFNGIFRAQEGRSLAARLVVYWTVLTLGPLLMGTAFALSGYVTAVGGAGALWARSAMGEWAFTWAHTGWNMASLMLPHLLTMTAFGLIYRLVPNRPVRTRDALVGAILAGLVFASLRYGFLTYFSRGGAYHTVYGALAALPLFLVWMYVSWMVVLGGAMVAAALPEWRLLLRQGEQEAVRPVWLALELLERLNRARPHGIAAPKLRISGVTSPECDRILAALAAHDMVLCGDDRWVVLADLENVTLGEVEQAVATQSIPRLIPTRGGRWRGTLAALLDDADGARRDVLAVPVARLFRQELPNTLPQEKT
jgi:membrane protein